MTRLQALVLLSCLVSYAAAAVLRGSSSLQVNKATGASSAEPALVHRGRQLQQATCWGVPPGFRFYPGFSFTQGTSAPCGNTFTVTSDILKTLGENCYKDNNCKGFTVNPVDANNGDNTLCVKNQTFLFSKLNTNQNDPCQGVFVRETCGQAVPTGYIFYPSYDIDSTNQVCVDYSAQQGWTLVNAYNDIRTVIISQCNSQQNCVGVSFLPGSGDVVARACYKNTFANLTRNSFTTTSPCQGVYVKASTVGTSTSSSSGSTTSSIGVTNDPRTNNDPPGSSATPSTPVPTPPYNPVPYNPPSSNKAPYGTDWQSPTNKFTGKFGGATGSITFYKADRKGMCYTQLRDDGGGLYACMPGEFDKKVNPNKIWPPPWCFNKARVCGPVGCTVVTFIDYCEECDIGHIDSTQEVFKLVAGDPGIGKQFGISWEFVDN